MNQASLIISGRFVTPIPIKRTPEHENEPPESHQASLLPSILPPTQMDA